MSENHLIHMSEDKSDLGKVEISPEVIEIITGLAASEVEGIAMLRGNFASGVAERLGRKSAHGKGVKVDLVNDGVKLDVYVITNYGVSIPEVCHKVQENIVQTLKNMTAIQVLTVDIHVVGVHFETRNEQEATKKN
ncbi:Asp23/Gls24 family envelope stress response protein [Salipaludibacillus agaradhaerens]|uniref:Asp23/Gls24 family envelope stress response protein n=1 Tax=Salipaludibacillus agaradhaerens TaxID=76935 RepID=A0A9Q4B1J9_SALAG|nr:Asp23/Gls24 family envelope stress response protein [Salipaludibacillus agaradhaerens]MCR6096668.1 Asp23/Gls24 family envelope stress response protein [Salipaludibacillus agaradhaerens]MCR6113773.1 Asp23/Gls24 family envelope stress response protein [Salipaludibacillus agaradhaerens]